jgi:hypothetical protein
MDLIMTIDSMLTETEKRIELVTKELKQTPIGRLMISNEKNGPRFIRERYRNGKRIRKGVARDPQLLYDLAHKEYLEQYRKNLTHFHTILTECKSKLRPLDPIEIIQNLHANFQLLDPARIINPTLLTNGLTFPNPSRETAPVQLRPDIGDLTPEQWGCMPYCENTSHLNHKTHKTPKGFYVRSKSEGSITGIYDVRPLFYHYDETFWIDNERISPDFVGVRRDGKLIIHEHFGLDDPQYNANNRRKLWLYEQAGFQQGHNLFLTYDRKDGSIDLQLIAALIDSYYEL